MKKYKIMITFTIGIALIITGICLGGINQVNTIQPSLISFNNQPKEDIDYQVKNYIDTLQIDTSYADMTFVEKDVQNLRVEAKNIYEGFQVLQHNQTLVIQQPYHFMKNQKAKITIVIPKDSIMKDIALSTQLGETNINQLDSQIITIHSRLGQLNIKEINCQKLNIDTDMGATQITKINCHKMCQMSCHMGSIDILFKNWQKGYNYDMNINAGSVSINGNELSGLNEKINQNNDETSHYLSIYCGMGSVNIETEE